METESNNLKKFTNRSKFIKADSMCILAYMRGSITGAFLLDLKKKFIIYWFSGKSPHCLTYESINIVNEAYGDIPHVHLTDPHGGMSHILTHLFVTFID